MNNIPHILHVFDPGAKHRNHEEVEFVKGRYIDIVNAKHKDPNTLYFGTSSKTNSLTGIFLGDTELTSKTKDVSLIAENGGITLSVKYVDPKTGKLSTVKTSLPSSKTIDEIKKLVNSIDTSILPNLDSSIKDLYKKVTVIDNSISNLDSSFVILKDLIAGLIEDISNGKIGTVYSIHNEDVSESTNYNKQYKLFKNDKEDTDSSVIEISDSKLLVLSYNKDTNTLEAKSWSSYIDKEPDSKFVNVVSTDMKLYDDHINEIMNTDSSINDRLSDVENLLIWESIH